MPTLTHDPDSDEKHASASDIDMSAYEQSYRNQSAVGSGPTRSVQSAGKNNDGVQRNENGSIVIPEGHDYAADNAVNRALDQSALQSNLARRAEDKEWYNNIKAGENKKAGSAKGDSKAQTSGQLADQESKAAQNAKGSGSGSSNKNTGSDSFMPTSQKQNAEKAKQKAFFGKLAGSGSSLKKKLVIAGAAAGGSMVLGVIVFLALLPLKIEHIVNNLQNHFSAAATQALDKQTERMFTTWVRKNIMPNLGTGTCHSTISPGCVSVASSSNPNNPVTRTFNAWRDGRLEQRLARDHGIIIGKRGNQFYMNVNGKELTDQGQFARVQSGEISLFDMDGTDSSTRSEIRRTFRTAMKEATLSDKIFLRFRVGPYLERKYGIKRCLVFCDARDKFSDNISDKKLAAKAYFVQRVISPLSENYGVILGCLFSGCSDELKLANLEPGEEEKLTPAQKTIRTQLRAFAAKFGEDALDDLVKKANDIGEKGFASYLADKAANKIGTLIGGEAAGAVAGEVASKAVPVAGWIAFIAHVLGFAEKVGPTLKYLGYSVNAAAAVNLFQSYQTLASEQKSGHIDPEILGSFVNALSTNVNKGDVDSVDATKTPLYNRLFGNGKVANSPSYTCNDAEKMASGSLVCPEENLSRGNESASAVSQGVQTGVSLIPGLQGVIDGVGKISSVLSDLTAELIESQCKTITLGIGNLCDQIMQTVSDTIAGWIIPWLMNTVLENPFSDHMSGGRTFDMMAAGADVSNNSACHVSLGCAIATNAQIAAIRQEQLNDDQADFESKSFFARMFDTSTPYSLVSRMAVAMPNSMSVAAASTTSSILTNPFGLVTSAFSNTLATPRAFAQEAATVTNPSGHTDELGVTNYYMPDNVIPEDPEAYWDANCTTQHNFDWANNQPQDPNTGESMATTPNVCLLISGDSQGNGGNMDASLLTDDGSSTGTPTATSGQPTGGQPGTAGYGATAEQMTDMPAACQNGSATGSVKFLCVGAKYRNLVPYLEVHPYTGKEFSEKWASGQRDGLTLDCSLFIGTVLYDAYGVDFTTTSGEYVNNTSLFRQIPLSEAQPGDFFHAPGHIGIVLVPGQSILDTGWTHPTSPVGDLDVHSWNNSADYALRYIGPGST